MIVLSIIRGGGERISRKPITSPLRLSFPSPLSFHFLPPSLPPRLSRASIRSVYHCFAPNAEVFSSSKRNSREIPRLETFASPPSTVSVNFLSFLRKEKTRVCPGMSAAGRGGGGRFAKETRATLDSFHLVGRKVRRGRREEGGVTRSAYSANVSSSRGGSVVGERFYVPIPRKYVIRSINDVQGERASWMAASPVETYYYYR